MEDQLEQFIKEETEIEETSTSGDAAWGFVHKQVIEIARVTLQRARDNSITCRIFADNSERCQVLKNDGKQKSGVISESVLNCIRKYMKITSRPSRLLQYIEFDTEEYISILDQLEDEGQTNNSRDPPHQYVLKKLGLDKPTSNMDNEKESSDENEIQQEKSQDVKINEADFEKHKLISQGSFHRICVCWLFMCPFRCLREGVSRETPPDKRAIRDEKNHEVVVAIAESSPARVSRARHHDFHREPFRRVHVLRVRDSDASMHDHGVR